MSSFLDQFDTKESSQSATKDPSLGVRAGFLPDQRKETVRHYRLGKTLQVISVLLFFTIVGYAAFYLWNQSRIIDVKDFSGQRLEEATVWCNQYGISIQLIREYDESNINTVIDQFPLSGEQLRKGGDLLVTVSDGRDPNELLPFKIEVGSSVSDVEAFVDLYQPNNLRVVETYHETIDVGLVSEIRFSEGSLKSFFRRKDSVVITISKGPEPFIADIQMPDFIGLTRSDVLAWHADKEFVSTFKFSNLYSNELPGTVIDQSAATADLVSRKAVLVFHVSAGPQVLVPDYNNSAWHEFDTIYTNGLDVRPLQHYHDSTPYGEYISQSIEAGSDVSGLDTEIVFVEYSLGRPYVPDLSGMSESDIPSFIYEHYTSKGAEITYNVLYDNKAQAMYGTISSVSKSMQFVSVTDHIDITVSTNKKYGIG